MTNDIIQAELDKIRQMQDQRLSVELELAGAEHALAWVLGIVDDPPSETLTEIEAMK